MSDALAAIMRIMHSAFDPAYGEAWNRQQVAEALALPNTHHLLAGPNGLEPAEPAKAVGFALTRGAADEEELLLIAVAPDMRGRGVGNALMERFTRDARARGAEKLFLEMREANPAEALYRRHGFTVVGRRANYYRSGSTGPFDAITYARKA